ncbi:MAG: DNA polymerase III subunit beta [bacterium]|nr:DNA polymerase III subunit beta [bacterium]
MKLEVFVEKIRSFLQNAERISGKNLSLPVLSGVSLSVKDKKLIIKATNLDIGVEFSLPVKVYKEGVVVVPASVLGSFVGLLKDGEKLILELSDNNLLLNSENSSASLKTFLAEDFPSIPAPSGGVSVEIPLPFFVGGLRSVYYSASVSNIKPELASVFIYTYETFLVFVATDSFRLAEKKVTLPKSLNIPPTLIPLKNISEIIRILETFPKETSIRFAEHQIVFEAPNMRVVSRVIDGAFPDYKQIIPKDISTKATVLKQDIAQALKAANVFSDNFHQLYFSINPKEGKFIVKSKNNEVGENTTSIKAALEGDLVDISFNYKYLVDFVGVVNSDSVIFSWSGSGKPLVLRGVGDSSFTYLVMPMNR